MKRLVLVPAILAVLAARADEPADRFRDTVTADRVVVDVRVIDNLGTPIAGLGVPDFSLRVDGRAVPIESVEWIPSGTPAPPSLAERAREPAADEPRTASPGRLVILFFKPTLSFRGLQDRCA